MLIISIKIRNFAAIFFYMELFPSTMKRSTGLFLLLFFMLVAGTMPSRADNPYKIDDRLYAFYERAEHERANERCVAIADSMLVEALRIGDKKAECLALVIPMRYYRRRGTRDQFKLSCERVREASVKNDYKQYYYYAYQLEVNYLIERDMLRDAEELLSRMSDETKADHDYYGLANCYTSWGNLYYYRRSFLYALEYYDRAIDIFSQAHQSAATVFSMAGMSSIKARQYERALGYFDRGLASDSIFPSTIITLLERKAIALFFLDRKNDFNEAYEAREEYIKKEGDNNTRIFVFLPFLKLAFDGQYDAAIEGMQDKKKKIDPFIYHLILKEIYTRTDNLPGALAEMDSLYEIRVVYFNKVMKEDLHGTASRLENERLKFEKTMLEMEEQRHRRGYITAIFSIAALFALVTLAIILILRIRGTRKLQAQNLQLEEARAHAEEAKAHAVKAQQRAEHSELMKTIFIQNMSHEIRTPLNAIVGFAQLLAEPDIADTFSDDEKREYSQLIGGNADMLMTLVNDILNISDLESGKYKMNLAPCECNEVCRFCLKNVEVRQPAGVRMYFTTEADDSFSLYTDRQRVQQVLTNFLTNACKHTSKGEIHLHLSLSENPGNVTFSVTDTGTGVPADQAEAIFERFTKLDSFKQGTGLGLAICRMIAEILHGEVKLDTTYTAGGARFVFIHPLTQEQA